jgi:hypothetical protein
MTATFVFKKSLFVILAASLVLVACKKEEKEEVDSDTQSGSDNALAEGAFNDVSSIADQADDGTLSTFRFTDAGSILGACSKINRLNSNASNPDTLLITFGTNNGANPNIGCNCLDGRVRKGSIQVVYTGNYRDSLSTHTITFANYFVNNNQLLGSKTVTNLGRNALGHPRFSVSVNGSVVLANNGGTITWVSSRTREWTAGYTTLGVGSWSDDEYLISGTANGTSASGNSFTAVITSPLKRALNCSWITSGKIEFTPAGKVTRTIDFGNGNCDDSAILTINGNPYTISLR